MRLLLLVAVALSSGCAMIYTETHQISGGEKVSIEVERAWPGFTSWGIIMMPAKHEYADVQHIWSYWRHDSLQTASATRST